MNVIQIGQKVSLKCGPDYPTETGVIVSLFDDHGIPAAMVKWNEDDVTDIIHLAKIKSSRAKYGLKLA